MFLHSCFWREPGLLEEHLRLSYVFWTKNITGLLGAILAAAWLWAPQGTLQLGDMQGQSWASWLCGLQPSRQLAHWHLDWAGNPCSWSALRLGQRSTIRTGAGLSTCSNLCKLGSSPKQLYGAAASYPAPFGHPRSMSLFGCPAYMQHPPLRVSNSDKSALNSTGIHNHKELRI